MASKLNLDDILDEQDSLSEPSVEPSFTLEDLLNEQEMLDEDGQDEEFDDMFEESDVEIEEFSDTKPSKRSDTVKSVSVFQVMKGQQVPAEVIRTTRIRNSQLKQQILNKNMTYTPLQTVSAAFDTNIKTARGVAVPNCLYSTSSKYLAIGTTLSNIALFEVGVKDFRILKEQTKMMGKPMSLCISDDNKWLVCGFEAGSIVLWDLATSSVVKTVTGVAFESPSIVKVQFWKGNTDFLSLDSSGNVVLHTIEKYLWTGIRSRKLFQTTAAVYHDARTSTLENGHIVLALANVDYVYLIRLEPSMQIMTKQLRPATAKPTEIPMIQLGKGRTYELMTDILVVCWGRTITIYKYNGLNRGDKLFEADRQFMWSQPVCNLQMLAVNMLLVVDSQNTFTVLNISQELDKGAIKNQTTLEQDLYFQRALRSNANEQLKLYSGSVCKCTQQFKEVFLLTKSSVIRGRLHRWTEFIRYLIQERQWDQILKASIEIFYGRLDIFAERVVISPITVMLFNELTVVYVKSKLEELQDRRGSAVELQVQEILDNVIEFCLQLKLYKHLFETIFELVGGYGLAEEYFESLGNFISVGRVPEVPNKFVLNALIEYFVPRKVELVDRLIASLRPSSLDYASTIEVCHKHKLFYSQMYVSQLSGDFVTSLNQVIAQCRKLSDQGYSNDQLQNNLQLTYSFVLGVLEGKTINGVQLNQELHEIGLKRIVIWYLIRQNSEFLIGEDALKYFDVLATMMTNPTVCQLSDSITETVSLAEYTCQSLSTLLDAIGKESYRQLLAEALIKISGVWELQSFWVLYVLQHLKPDIEEEWLTKFVNKHLPKILEADTSKLYEKVLPKGVLADILLRQERYVEAIAAYEQLNDATSIQRLFHRIPEECLLLHLSELTKINPKFAGSALYSRLSGEGIDEALSHLPDNIYKYELMRAIFRLDRTSDIRWRESNCLFYLQSLCQYRDEKRVYEELRRRDFNILEALNVVRASGFKLCEAYLEEVNCEALLSFRLYCRVFQQQLKSDFSKILRFKLVSGRQLKKIFHSALRMLNSLPFDDGNHYLELFDVVFGLLSQKGQKKQKQLLLQEMDEVFRKKGKLHQHFSKIFTEIICETLQRVAAVVTPAQMKVLVDTNLALFAGRLMQERLRLALSDEQHTLVMTKSAECIAMADINLTFRKAMNQKSKAVPGSSWCSLCQKRIVMSQAFVYPCGCSMHQECLATTKRDQPPQEGKPLRPEVLIALGTGECPCCKMRQEPSARELRKQLRPCIETPKKDLRKSSASLNEQHFYFSCLSFDESKKCEEEERFEYLMS